MTHSFVFLCFIPAVHAVKKLEVIIGDVAVMVMIVTSNRLYLQKQ